MGSWVNDGLSFDECLENAFLWNAKNPSPLPEKEIERTVRSIFDKHHKEKPSGKVDMTPVHLRDLINKSEEATEWLVDELLPTGGFSGLSAKPKVGKSTLARNLTLSIAQGTDFLGRKTNQGAVIYYALEDKQSKIIQDFKAMGFKQMITDDDKEKIQDLKVKGYSQAKVARELGLSRSTVARYWKHSIPESVEKESSLKEKKQEVKELKLDIAREKASRVLSHLKGDAVKQARDELEILRIRKEKEQLLQDEKRQMEEKKASEARKRWITLWFDYALRYFSLDFLFRGTEPEPIPLDWKIKIKQTIKEAIEDVPLSTDNVEEVKALVNKTVDSLRENYNEKYLYPEHKRELINIATGLIFPLWLKSDTKKLFSHISGRPLKLNS
ncbi:MAG: AAA family ATPase [Nitrospirota bacterium]